MPYAHLCPFCGWHRPADSVTMLAPACEECGGTLRAVEAADLEEERREDAVGHVIPARSDSTAMLALLLVTPWLLPLVGVELGDVTYGVPLVLLIFAALRLWRASREDPAAVVVHRALAVSCAAAATASALAIAAAVTAGTVGALPFYAGLVGSCANLVAAVALVRDAGTSRRWAPLVDAGLLALVAAAVVGWFVVLPGLRDGDVALTVVVLVDLLAVIAVALAAVARSRGRRATWWFAGGCVAVLAGDGLVSGAAAGQVPELAWLTALLWAAAGFAFAAVGEIGLGERRKAPAGEASGVRWLAGRVALPLAAVLAFPAVAGALAVFDRLTTTAAIYFGALGVAALVAAFVRQARLLLDDRTAVVRERAMRHEATRRNEELEALTGLATTMTQTLEEAPIVEQALGVLRAAARATSAALHVEDEEGGTRLAAAVGHWGAERIWASDAPLGDDPVLTVRGRRAVLRLPLDARGRRIGTVTLVRPEQEPFDPAGAELLRLLVGQMAVAVQNARDYREKLEQAIRDPLTGIYNRRFMLEALEKEVQRVERYGSEASLVLFDVDDFKLINDGYGHATGDDVLRAIAEVAGQVVRPADSFARIGGEEFALLLPETGQLEALLVADRLRTAVARRTILPGRKVTLSGGVASCPGDALTADDLQRRADAALYWAKRNGKDLCSVASEAIADGEATPGADGLVAHLYALVAMIDARELHTRDHSENVATYAVAIGQAAGLERERIVALRRAAMLHDVGKIAVRSHILEKPGRLTEDEFSEIRRHSDVGGIMLAHAGLEAEATWVRHHHERVDGQGYPDGLAGDALPVEARILFVADAFEAMTSDRPYRSGMPPAAAVAELRRCAGTQFDERIVDLLADLVESGRLAVLALRRDPAAHA